MAQPTGAQVTAGSGSVTQTKNTTTVSQTSETLSLNWQSFNVASNETVNFVQPNAAAIAVNRILSNTGSEIFGHLNANGQVWLINPNGVLFGAGSQVNVGGLIASTLAVNDVVLGSSARTFGGTGTGSIVNQGALTAANGGYVALLGNRVVNQGLISAQLGTVALGAGSAATLTFSGKQLIHLKVDQSTLDNLADNRELIEADGGRVIMTAGAQDSLLASVVNNSGVVQARSVEEHDGTITLLAGMRSGTVQVGGTLDATAPAGLAGGTIETSGASVSVAKDARIDAGPGGSWLIDPTDLTIDSAAATTIDNSLNGGTSVTEQTTATTASGSGTQAPGTGSINVDAPLTWTNAAASLTLSAYNAINVNSAINGAGSVLMQAGAGNGAPTSANITIASGASITGANVTLAAGNNFINQAGAGALTASGRWLVYSTNPTLDTDAGLAANFVQYAAPFQTAPAQGAGNGLLYSVAPTISVTALNGTPTKVYDGTATAALTPSNYTVTGLINGDSVTSMNGTYQSTDVGSNIDVTSAPTASALTVATGNNIPVYGYALAAPITAAIGSITPAPLTASIVGNPTKVYDSTTTATLSAANYALSGFASGQGASVNQPSSVAYGAASAGSQTITATFANTNFTADSGTKLSNYVLPTSATGPGTVQQAPLEIQGVVATNKVYDATTADSLNTTQASLYGIIGSDSVTLSSANAVGNFATSQVGNNRSVTSSGFTLSGAQQADYVVVQPTGLTASITPAPLTVSGVSATSKVYDGTTADVLNVSNAALSGVLGTDAANLTLTAGAAAGTFSTRNVGTNLSVATSGFTLGGSAASNYTLTQPASLTANITAAPLNVSLVGNPTKLYNGTSTAALSSSNFSITGFVSGEGATIPQTALAEYDSPNAGARTVTATLAASDFATTGATLLSNYSIPTSVTGGGTITPAPLTGTLIGDPTKTYDGTATAMLTSANYSLSGFLAGQGATVTQGSGAYASANAGVQTVSATLTPGNYTASSGTLLSNYVLPTVLSGPGTITPAAVGDTIYAGIVGNPSKTYDGTTTATLTSANYQLTGFVNGQGATVTQTVGQYGSANAGVQEITAALSSANFTADSGTNLSNYTLPTSAYGTGTITPALLTATIVGNPTRVYNGSTSMVLQPANYSVAGFVAGEGASINPSALINYASPNVGSQNITAALTPTAYTATGNTLLSNYTLATSASGLGTITPAPVYVIGVYGTNKVYDTTVTDPLNTAAAGLSGVVSSDAGNLILSGTAAGAFSTIHVGNNLPVSVSGLSLGGSAASNYQLEPVSGLTANITPAPLSISGVIANSKPYDATDAASLNTSSAALVGLLGSDSATLSAAGATAAFSGVNVGSNLKVTASGFSIAGSSASDYALAQPTGLTANITPAPITALITGNPTKVYDGSSSTTLTAANYTLTGFVPNQGATVPQSATANYAAPDAGSNITVNSTLVLSDFVASSGTNLSNYQLPITATGLGTITQAPLNVALVGNPTKVYDGTASAALTSANYSVAGFVSGQSATVTQTSGSYASANAGAEAVTANLGSGDYAAGSGTNLQNYVLPTSVTGPGTITRASLTAINTATTPRIYDGTTVDALSGAQLSGTVYAGDSPALTNTASGLLSANGNAGTDMVTTNFGLTGAGSNNYTVIQPSGLTAVISPAPLTATSSVTKTYDGTTTAVLSGANTSFSGFVAGQGATVNSGVTGTFSSANVGSGLAVTGGALSAGQLTANSGTLLSNYSLPASDNGTGAINPATLTYTATPSSSQYGTTPVGLTGGVSGFVNGETLTTATTGITSFTTAATSTSNVGHYAIDGSGLTADNGNYVFVQAPANATALLITPAPLSIVNVATTNRLYNGTTVDALSGATLVGTFYNGDAPTLTNTASGILSNSGNVGTDAVTTNFGLTGVGSGNYSVTQPSGLSAVISAVALSATSTVSKVYDGTTVANLSGTNTVLTGFISGQGATVNGGVTGTFSSANVGSGITITGGALTSSELTPVAGTTLANYVLPVSDNGSGAITPKVISLTGTRVYDAGLDADSSVFASAGTVNGVNGEKLYLGGSGTLAGKNAGSESLASLGSLALSNDTGLASNYTLIGGTDSVTVTPLGITVTGTAANKVYDATTTAGGVILASSGVLGGDTVTFTDTGANFASKNVGTGIAVTISGITAGGASAGNYTVNASTVTAADITPATINLAGSRVYDAGVDANATIFGSAGTLTGVGSETLTLTGAGTLAAKNAGPESVASLGTLTLGNGSGLASNYTLLGGTDTATISKLGITVAGTAANKVYDATTTAAVLTLGSSGVLAGDAVNFADSTANFTNKNVGSGKTVTISGITDSGTDAGNYTLNNVTASTTANITPLALTVTGTAANKVYDATTTAAVLTLGSSGVLAGDTVNFADASATFADKNVGTGKTVTIAGITDSGTDAGNYTLSNTIAGTTANITPLGLTVTGTAANKVYDATTTASGVVLASSGVLAGDTVNFADASATFADKNVGSGKAVTISGITDSGTDAGNYTLNNTTASTTANITPLGLTVTGTAANKVYDATTTAAILTLGSSGVLAGDTVNFADASANFANKNVGTGKTVTISGITDSGSDAGNYSLNNNTASTTANITPLGLTVTATAANKVYDATTTATGVTLASSGILAGDTVNFADTSASFTDKNVGTGKTVTISGITDSGIDAGNYTLASTTTTTTANITPLGITVSGTGINKVYDGSVNDPVNLASSGVIAGDTVNFAAASATFADKNVGTGKAVSIAGITDSGSDAGNYTLNNSTASTTANITPLALTVTGTAANKVYDGNTTATGVMLGSSGVVAGDAVNFADTSASFTDKNVGTGKTVTIAGITDSGGDAGNYTLYNTSTTTLANITPLNITVSGSAASKVYDATPTATGVTLTSTGVLAGDTVNFADASASFADKNVGAGKTVTIAGITASGTDAGDYAFNSTTTATASITPLAVTVSATGTNKVYDGGVNDAVSLASSGVIAGDSVNFAAASATFADKNVGIGKPVNIAGISDSGTDAGNYTLNNTTASTTANIAPLALTVTGTAANKVYDATTAATGVTLTSSGVLAGDSVNFADASATFANKNVGTGKTVTIAGITDNGTDAGNYTLNSTTTTTTANITPLAIAVSGTGTNKVYDGTTLDTVSLASSGVLAGDTLSFSDTSATFTDKNVGNGKAVTIAGITAAGADAANYSVNSTAMTTAAITPAVLTETAGSVTIPSGQTPRLGGTVSGFVAGDSLANATTGQLTWATSSPVPQQPGIYAVDGAGLTAKNYLIEQAPGNADALTVTAALDGPLQHAEGLTGVPLGQDPLATPYGIGSANYDGNNTGNARRDTDPTDPNRRLSDFSGRVALRVVGPGVRLPPELHD